MAIQTGDEVRDVTQDVELDQILYARHAEIENLNDLSQQRGTNIPALFSTMYKFIQNPSSVSVETFKRMVDTDDTVGAGTDFLTTCLAARLGSYTHPNKDISLWVNKVLAQIEGGWFNVVKELLSATWAGFAVQEKVWANDDKLGFIIKKCVALPPSTILFETERTGELTPDGILQYQRNWNPMSLGVGIGYFGGLTSVGFGFNAVGDARPDPFAKFGDLPFPMRTANVFNYLSIRIPRQKCIHYAFDAQGKFGNPYGRSLLRRAYKYYVMKDSFLQMLAVALDRKGTPLTIVYADPNTTLADPSKTTQGVNAKGQKVGIRADQAAKQAFENIHNDTTVILPGKKGQIYDTDFVTQSSNNDAFLESLDFCNKSIMRALLIPSLIFGNGDGSGSFALGQEHARTFLKILDGMLEGLKGVIISQVIKELVMYNFPSEVHGDDGFGDFQPKDFTEEEMAKIMDIYDKGITAGVIDTNDLNDLNRMREVLGFEERQTPIEKPMQMNDFNMWGADNGSDFGSNQPGDQNGGPGFFDKNDGGRPGNAAEPPANNSKPGAAGPSTKPDAKPGTNRPANRFA